MAGGRRVVIKYLLAVWCCADTLVVRALLPSSVQGHAEPAVSSGNRAMGALHVVTSPLSSPDRLKQPETSIIVDPVTVTVSEPLHSVIAGEVCPCNSPKDPRMRDGDDEKLKEHRKQGELERGDSSGGGGHDSVVIDVRESKGTGCVDVADDCAVCLDQIRGKGPVRSWKGCGHQFHTACIKKVDTCPLCRCSRTGTPAPALPDNSLAALVVSDGPHTLDCLGCGQVTMQRATIGGVALGLICIGAFLLAQLLVNLHCKSC